MPVHLREPGSRYLVTPLRTLYDVCRETGRDREGGACPTCHIRDICTADRERPLGTLTRPLPGAH